MAYSPDGKELVLVPVLVNAVTWKRFASRRASVMARPERPAAPIMAIFLTWFRDITVPQAGGLNYDLIQVEYLGYIIS